MKTYIVLLRGINVSGQKKIRMAELRNALMNSGFGEVSTYIQSGNIILRDEEGKKAVTERVQACILREFGFDVPALTFEPQEWREILANMPYPITDANQKNFYFVFLFETPVSEHITTLAQESFPNEEFIISTRCIYLNCHQGYGTAKTNNNYFEKRLQVRATARNLRTVQTLGQMASEMD